MFHSVYLLEHSNCLIPAVRNLPGANIAEDSSAHSRKWATGRHPRNSDSSRSSHQTSRLTFSTPFGPVAFHHRYKRSLPAKLTAVYFPHPTLRTKPSTSTPQQTTASISPAAPHSTGSLPERVEELSSKVASLPVQQTYRHSQSTFSHSSQSTGRHHSTTDYYPVI